MMAPMSILLQGRVPGGKDTSGRGVASTYAQSVSSSGELGHCVALPEAALAQLPGTLLALEVWCL